MELENHVRECLGSFHTMLGEQLLSLKTIAVVDSIISAKRKCKRGFWWKWRCKKTVSSEDLGTFYTVSSEQLL